MNGETVRPPSVGTANNRYEEGGRQIEVIVTRNARGAWSIEYSGIVISAGHVPAHVPFNEVRGIILGRSIRHAKDKGYAVRANDVITAGNQFRITLSQWAVDALWHRQRRYNLALIAQMYGHRQKVETEAGAEDEDGDDDGE